MTANITVRKCESLKELKRCCELQRVIWKEADLDVEPVTVMVVAAHTGGHVLGAFDGDRLVGFAEAIVGLKNGQPYLHSHVTGVAEGYRDRGVGRALKLFQREEALSRGIKLIQWTFDPLEARNAHFNLNRLGAICSEFIPNLYGVTSSPLHRGLPTDRFLAEWHLDSARVESRVKGEKPSKVSIEATIHIPPDLEQWKKTDTGKVISLQRRLAEEFTKQLGKGYAVVGITISDTGAAYELARRDAVR
jgi:predicted GNAT superfamily acetyltransferase